MAVLPRTILQNAACSVARSDYCSAATGVQCGVYGVVWLKSVLRVNSRRDVYAVNFSVTVLRTKRIDWVDRMGTCGYTVLIRS